MDSKKKQQYIIISTVPIMMILTYFSIASLINLGIIINNFSFLHTATILCDITPLVLHNLITDNFNITQIVSSHPITHLPTMPLHHDITSHLDISLNYFISGIFYGMAFLGFIASLIIYQIFREKKWISYLAIQALIFTCFIYSDILNIFHIDLTPIESFFRATIVAGSLIFTGMLISTYYPFSAKRFMYKNELNIYSITSIIALVLYFSSYIYGEGHLLLLDITVIILFVATQYISRILKRRSRYYLYVILLLSLCLLYGICFTNMEVKQSLVEYNQTMNSLKLCVIVIIIFSIINNYVLVRKTQKHNVRNRVFMFQYVLMLKNYHKLLLNEKNAQSSKTSDASTLKDHQGDLSYYLKNTYKLTEREVDVLYLIWDGLTNKEIAHKLSITISTTKYHISNIYLKLNVNSRSQVFALKDW